LEQALLQGLLLGGLYATIGVGMSMIFGIARITNLAHGDFLILAAYISQLFITILGVNPFISLIFVVPIMFLIGYAVQTTLLNKVLGRGTEPPLLVTFGLSIIIKNLLLYFFTANTQRLSTPLLLQSIVITDTLRVPILLLIACLSGVVLILMLNLYLKRTYMGRAIRATSDDIGAAQLMGVNIKTIYGIAMGIAMITAGFTGVLVGTWYTFTPTSGSTHLLTAFAVVVIGGIGSINGTLLAGFIFGLAQAIGGQFLGVAYQQLISYLILLIMLIVRPQGLMSK
jgi:branched-chain amino acid transport system permease protein